MFTFIVEYFGFMKAVPLFPHLFDSIIKLGMLVSKPKLLDWIDEVEAEVLAWDDTSITLHRYGGIQFNFNGKEIGHLHSNGLLDIPYNRKVKMQLLSEDRVQEHHVFKKSGWTSFYLNTPEDVMIAKELLMISYSTKKADIDN